MQERHLLAFIGYFKKQNELQFLAISVFEKKRFCVICWSAFYQLDFNQSDFCRQRLCMGDLFFEQVESACLLYCSVLTINLLKVHHHITACIHLVFVICIFFWQYVILVLAENPYQGAVSVLTVLFALGIRYTDLEQVGVTVGTVCNYIMIPVRALQSFNCSRVCNYKKETFWWLFWRKIWGFLIKAY